jgi:hypothetical protein
VASMTRTEFEAMRTPGFEAAQIMRITKTTSTMITIARRLPQVIVIHLFPARGQEMPDIARWLR